jgi:hypothetical protein
VTTARETAPVLGTESLQLLISIQNVAANPRRSCLLRMDPATGHKQWVDVGINQLLASGLGIYAGAEHIFHVCIANDDFGTWLTVLDRRSLAVLHTQPLPEVSDGHSIVCHEGELIVVSTGTDEIVGYELDGIKPRNPRIVWSPTDLRDDTHHVNSLTIANGDLLCSAFGPKEGDSWTTVSNGYVRNLTRDTVVMNGLRQPHSATWSSGQLFVCNSLEGSVNTVEGVLTYMYGYARGLTFGEDGTMYAGTSLSRRPSDTTSDAQFRNPSDPGELHGQCAVTLMAPGAGHRLELGMAPFGNEIYDIVVLHGDAH